MNLFDDLPHRLVEEQVETLATGAAVRIERIISTGQASPAGFWYDQLQDEWVTVLQGEAELLIEGEETPRRLCTGDCLTIPAHCRHRVERTSVEPPTIWLTVFFDSAEEGGKLCD